MSGPASILLQRRIEWSDTDAAGIYHWVTAFRLVEAAEAEMHDRLGIRHDTFGRMPRAHVDADFRTALRFYDTVDVELTVSAVGRSSVTYTFAISCEGVLAVTGRLVAVLVEAGVTGAGLEIPDAIRRPLLTAGRL